MILLDYSQTAIAALMQQVNSNPKIKIEEGLVRHIVLNTIRSFNKQFKSKYGQMVICCDNRNYWRRGYFKHYKASRKKNRDKSAHDWTMIFETLNKIRDEIKQHMPYRVVDVEGAEADDIIAILAARNSPHEDVLIISSDKDFTQLQKYDGVVQWSPYHKRFIKTDDPAAFLREHILRGDEGDGVPNFLSDDDTFVSDKRQKPINSKKLSEWLVQNPSVFCDTDAKVMGFARNQVLVDFDYIPKEIGERIVNAFQDSKPGSKSGLLNYLIANKMKNLIEVAGDF
jgi:hypothetical protein